MEPQNEGLVQMIFLFISAGVSGSILIFRGIYLYIMYTDIPSQQPTLLGC